MPKSNLHVETSINAKPDEVWKAFSDLNSIHKWSSWLKVEAPADVKAGSTINITLGHSSKNPSKFTPQVITYGKDNSVHELRWRGKLWNSDWFFVGEHYFRMEPDGRNKTKFVHGEDFQGLLIPLLGGMLSEVNKEFANFNNQLKGKCEGK